MKKRIAVVICVIALAICQAGFVIPEKAYAETAGETLIVRVQYAGEREEKIREKARFTRSELRAMGASTQRYSNVTEVGTILSILAIGPKLSTVIEQAGIDLNSVKYITFRTTDGTGEHQRYSRNFTVSQHLNANRYYYPKLRNNYERNEDETLTPLTGALEGGTTVPSILALESASTKQPNKELSEADLSTEEIYRFCLGQTPLQENVKTRSGYDGGDVSSMESAQWIFGVDITLYGSPVEGLKLDLDDKNLKVGSKKKVSAVIEGDELFQDDWGFSTDDLTWKSSDTSIATIDENGVITVKKEGTVTITATAPNGMSASVTINATAEEEEKQGAAPVKGEDKKDTKRVKDHVKKEKEKKEPAGIVVKEVKIGGLVAEEAGQDDLYREQMAEDAQALDKAEESNPQVVFFSAFNAVVVFGFGIVFRIRRFFKEV